MRLPILCLALAALAACTLDPGAGGGLQPKPRIEQVVETPSPVSYAAAKDGKFTIPAVDPAKVPLAYQRTVVQNPIPEEAPGTLLVDTQNRFLYLVQDQSVALRYGIGVGREGFGWTGEAVADRKAQWPVWTPPPEMIKRQPELAQWKEGRPGGPRNPLGARAIYLSQNGHDTGFRIHGTPEWRSIGSNASSGCFRMIQQDVVDLHARVSPGAKVIVR